MSVVIETTVGDITVDLHTKERPNTCLNFLKLCKIKFYNLCLFYKIEKKFIAQAGDPTATGRGGESVFCHLYGDQAKYFDAEFKPRLRHEKLGTLSMVNNGNNMNGSQFFLTLSENLTYLDEKHSVFGEVVEGFDVLLKLNDAICDNNNRPYQDIRITHTVILHDPFEDPKSLEIPDASPEPTREMLESGYIAPDEEIDDNKGKTAEEVEEKIKESEAKARATILEMVGDIPDAEVKPPENVLFVCKLNPVTTSEDLEVIFSRFGKILSCEVIKDKKTGESLQYAFIEFEKEEDCEAAYFKMDNVLIDDRRIHVDFSQSVSKLYFNRDKLPNTKKFKSNFSLKETDRNDGYDLIFDQEGDNIVHDKSHKSNFPHSISKTERKRNKYSPYHEGKEKRDKREEYDSSYRKYNDSRNYSSVKKSYSHREYDQSHSSDRRTSDKDRSHRYKEDYFDKNRALEQSKGHKYKDEEYSSSGRKKDSDHQSKYRHSSDNTSKYHRYSGNYRKSSPELYSQKPHTSIKRTRKDSTSPDQARKSYEKSRSHSNDYAATKKYSERPDYNKYAPEKKAHDYKSKDVIKQRIKSSHKQKKDKLEKSSSKKIKTKKTKSSSVSNSTSSSSSSSSSTSASDSSSDSSQSNRKKRHPQKRKKKTKSSKKRKYNS